jgi:hypothetical protein
MDDRLLLERLIEEVEERVKAESTASMRGAQLLGDERKIGELAMEIKSLTGSAATLEQSVRDARAERDSIHALHAKTFAALDELRQAATSFMLQVHEHPKSGLAERNVLEERLRSRVAAARAIYDEQIPF